MMRPILLVEDNENDVFFMQRALKLAEVVNPVRVIENGQEAVRYFEGSGPYADRQQHPLPCLVLLDLKLPYIPGLEVLKWIRQHPDFETVVVVVLTSSSLDADIETAYRLGANSFLVKPPTPTKLQEMVNGIREYWLKLNRPASEWVKFASSPSCGTIASG